MSALRGGFNFNDASPSNLKPMRRWLMEGMHGPGSIRSHNEILLLRPNRFC